MTTTITIQDMTSGETHDVPASTPVLEILSARDFGADPTTGIEAADAGYTTPGDEWDGLTVAELKPGIGGGYVWDAETKTWYLSRVIGPRIDVVRA